MPTFEKAHDVQVQVIAVGTGKALKMGEAGDVDLVMTHAPGAEKAFVDAGFGVEPTGLMYNDFVVIGPSADPAGIAAESDVAKAMASIANTDSLFISRGDDSGTHKKNVRYGVMRKCCLTLVIIKKSAKGWGKCCKWLMN